VPDLTRGSFEALLSRFESEQHQGQEGWVCSGTALFVPGQSLSHDDPGFNATTTGCESLCARTSACEYWQWGHTRPKFAPPLGWCYLYEDCGTLKPDDAAAQYEPKYTVNAMHANGTSYARERRFFLSSTPTSVQPTCDAFCIMEDLCDKASSGMTTSNQCFTECLETNGRRLIGGAAASHALA